MRRLQYAVVKTSTYNTCRFGTSKRTSAFERSKPTRSASLLLHAETWLIPLSQTDVLTLDIMSGDLLSGAANGEVKVSH